MAAPTSDERREVAAMLRWLASDPGAQTRRPYGPDTYAITCDVIFGEPCYGPSEPQFLNRLADLIDPTCEVVDVEKEPGGYQGTGLCSKCGALLLPAFVFCPQCGSRVTNWGER